MSKRLSLLAAFLVGAVLGLAPYMQHKYQVSGLYQFTEQLGCIPLGPETMSDTPVPNAKALICPLSGLVIAIV